MTDELIAGLITFFGLMGFAYWYWNLRVWRSKPKPKPRPNKERGDV